MTTPLPARTRSLGVALLLAATLIPRSGLAASACDGEDRKQIGKAVKLATAAEDRAAKKSGVPDFSRVERAAVSIACRDEAVALGSTLAELCYGTAYDQAGGAFPSQVSDRCAALIGRSCSKALVKEVRSPGDGLGKLERIARSCGDPISGDLGGACDGVAANAAAVICLSGEIGALAAAIAPPDPAPVTVTPADCGFPGSGVVKPVVPGAEFDPALSPWLQAPGAAPAYEPAAANQSQVDYMRPKSGATVNLSVREWTFPVYNVVADALADCGASLQSRCFSEVTIEDVYLTQPWNPSGSAIVHVPVPAGVEMRPDPMGDSHLAIVDWVHGIEYDFWACKKNGDGTWKKVSWPTSKGGDGQPHYACQAGGKLYLEGTGTNLLGPDSSKGSGFALTAGLIRPEELAAEAIGHALAVTTTAAASGGPVAPANLSDGEGPAYPDAPPEGARFRLDPLAWDDATIDAQAWTATEKAIARALRDYGAIVSDQGGSDADFYTEGSAYVAGLYDGIDGIDAGAATVIFSPALFDASKMRFLLEAGQDGLNEDGSRDLDGDGMFDSFEIAMGWYDGYRAGSAANAADDPDGDGLSNLEEQRCLFSDWAEYNAVWPGFAANPAYQYPCNPFDADSDHDGSDDAAELAAGTDPSDPCSHP